MEFGTYDLTRSDGWKRSFPMAQVFELTEAGRAFVTRMGAGSDINDLSLGHRHRATDVSA